MLGSTEKGVLPVSEEKVRQEDVPQSEVVQEEVPQETILQDLIQEEVLQEEVPQEEVPQEEVPHFFQNQVDDSLPSSLDFNLGEPEPEFDVLEALAIFDKEEDKDDFTIDEDVVVEEEHVEDKKKEGTVSFIGNESDSQASSEEPSLESFVIKEPRYDELTSQAGFGLDTVSMKTFQTWEDLKSIQDPSIKKEVEDIALDRNLYYELYALYSKQYQEEKLKNAKLQTKMVEYYSKRKMYQVLATDKSSVIESSKRYEKILDEFDAYYDMVTREQSNLLGETENLKNKAFLRQQEVKILYEKLHKMEYDFCQDLINAAPTSSEKAYAERIAERFLKRQKHQVNTISKMRLEFIRFRNKHKETCDALDALDSLGPKFRIIDYQQLKQDNRNLYDKLEEKDMALASVRRQCQHLMQVLAHTREKVDAVQKDITKFNENLEIVTEECVFVREQVHSMKKEKDGYRYATVKFKEELGLLTKPKLLKDMERSIQALSDEQKKLAIYKMEFAERSKDVEDVRNKINSVIDTRRILQE